MRRLLVVTVLVLAAYTALLLAIHQLVADPGKTSAKARPSDKDDRRGNAAAAAKTGSIIGEVELAGKPPVPARIDKSPDPVCARTGRHDESVVVSDGKLRDVHVRIAVGTAGKHSPPEIPAVINQLDCMYVPRVIGAMEGQKIAIENSDPTYHNVRGSRGKRTLWNVGQPARAPAIVREDAGKAGEVATLHCDVHPWMRAYAVITDHPYFAVTGDDGAFTIADVPAGTYTLEAWHPELGLKSTSITVRAGHVSKARFRF